jgi:hypothetical protein
LGKDAPKEIMLNDNTPGIPRLAGDPSEEEEPEPKGQETDKAAALARRLRKTTDD